MSQPESETGLERRALRRSVWGNLFFAALGFGFATSSESEAKTSMWRFMESGEISYAETEPANISKAAQMQSERKSGMEVLSCLRGIT